MAARRSVIGSSVARLTGVVLVVAGCILTASTWADLITAVTGVASEALTATDTVNRYVEAIVSFPRGDSQPANPLYAISTDPNGISMRVKLAGSSLDRAIALMSRPSDPTTIGAGIASIRDTYSYLRAAQEGAMLVLGRSKFPDPLLDMQRAQMWQVRRYMLKCLDVSGHLTKGDPDLLSACSRHLAEGKREYDALMLLMP
jgi:hypothetical protein